MVIGKRRKNLIKGKKIVSTFTIVVLVLLVSSLSVTYAGNRSGVSLPKGTPLKSLAVIPSSNLTNNEDKVLVAALQGIVAKSSSEQIFIDEGGPGATWKNYMSTTYNIKLNDQYSTWPLLVEHFKDKVKGYIVYDMNNNASSLNVATSLSGPMNALIIDKSQEEVVRSIGITNKILDVSGKNEKWAYDNYKNLFSKSIAAELNTSIYYHLRDYAALTNSFTFFDGVTNWRKGVLNGLNKGSALMGYGNNEFDMIEQASQKGITSIPSDLAPNLSALSSIYSTEGLKQQTYSNPITKKKHYVTFVISDGDNIAWNLWGLNEYFNNPDRGKFSVGYGISPTLVDLAPAALRWYYENATKGKVKDHFIAGPSGTGYIFPSQMSSSDLDTYVDNLNTYMGKADLRISEILDQGALTRTDIWKKYLAKPNIDALFYFGYGETTHGDIQWVNNKPVIAQRDVLWDGITDEETLITNINSRPASPTTADGYTLVLVHCWTKSLSDIKTVVEGLSPNVEVVTPDEYVKLVKQNHAK
ncbi:GxGYxYP domain-containing protein [Paenibacillus solisilvae]|uniref:GxGYxYP domain-containing protein n=1 Tax=Paenibacillus solisilvae TaxID=2486751 RepID=A0ABW0VWB5_9BACL